MQISTVDQVDQRISNSLGFSFQLKHPTNFLKAENAVAPTRLRKVSVYFGLVANGPATACYAAAE